MFTHPCPWVGEENRRLYQGSERATGFRAPRWVLAANGAVEMVKRGYGSVDRRAGTFVALARRDHTTDRILARCGTVCHTPGKNFAGFWSLPASQVAFDVIRETETEGLQTQ